MPVNDEIAAFSDIFRKHYPELCAYAFSLLNDQVKAVEAVLQVFSHGLPKRSFSNMQHSFIDHLYTCVHHQCLHMLKETAPTGPAQNDTDQSLKMFTAGPPGK